MRARPDALTSCSSVDVAVYVYECNCQACLGHVSGHVSLHSCSAVCGISSDSSYSSRENRSRCVLIVCTGLRLLGSRQKPLLLSVASLGAYCVVHSISQLLLLNTAPLLPICLVSRRERISVESDRAASVARRNDYLIYAELRRCVCVSFYLYRSMARPCTNVRKWLQAGFIC